MLPITDALREFVYGAEPPKFMAIFLTDTYTNAAQAFQRYSQPL
jgi:hypothetical protein